ncbi:hypothetical protein LCGC14_1820630 [marine sediment metagenome]|uniref:Uncharacterized protein n=1 Tax=marine sediment metagenome TaxID=412755 RepID=A0A0F9GJ25_9ZZZZ
MVIIAQSQLQINGVFQVKRRYHIIAGVVDRTFTMPLKIEAKSDIEVRGTAAGGGGAVSASFDLTKATVKKVKAKKQSWDISREAKTGIRRAKKLRKMKGEEVMFGAKADREEQKARVRTAQLRGRPKKKSKTKGLSKKLGMRFF